MPDTAISASPDRFPAPGEMSVPPKRAGKRKRDETGADTSRRVKENPPVTELLGRAGNDVFANPASSSAAALAGVSWTDSGYSTSSAQQGLTLHSIDEYPAIQADTFDSRIALSTGTQQAGHAAPEMAAGPAPSGSQANPVGYHSGIEMKSDVKKWIASRADPSPLALLQRFAPGNSNLAFINRILSQFQAFVETDSAPPVSWTHTLSDPGKLARAMQKFLDSSDLHGEKNKVYPFQLLSQIVFGSLPLETTIMASSPDLPGARAFSAISSRDSVARSIVKRIDMMMAEKNISPEKLVGYVSVEQYVQTRNALYDAMANEAREAGEAHRMKEIGYLFSDIRNDMHPHALDTSLQMALATHLNRYPVSAPDKALMEHVVIDLATAALTLQIPDADFLDLLRNWENPDYLGLRQAMESATSRTNDYEIRTIHLAVASIVPYLPQ